MTTADRVDPVGYRAWAPAVVIPDGSYVGKHRRGGIRLLSLRVFYTARHLAPRG